MIYMETIALTGRPEGSGRTKLGVMLTNNLRCGIGILKGEIKDSGSAMVTDDHNIMRAESPEISPYLNSGAAQIIYLSSTMSELNSTLEKAYKMLAEDIDYLLVEGNEIAEYINPGLIIYVSEGEPLDSAVEKVRREAQLIVDYVELQNNKDLTDLKFTLPGDEISCYRAQLISDLLGFGYGEFGRKLNRESIKVRHCQLGLFK